MASVSNEPYKRWNFLKANWKLYSLVTNKLSQELPLPDCSFVNEAYQDFCNIIFAAAKISIPRGRRNTTDRAETSNVSTYAKFFFGQNKVRQLVELHPPCFLVLTKNKKIIGLRLSNNVVIVDASCSLNLKCQLQWNCLSARPCSRKRTGNAFTRGIFIKVDKRTRKKIFICFRKCVEM